MSSTTYNKNFTTFSLTQYTNMIIKKIIKVDVNRSCTLSQSLQSNNLQKYQLFLVYIRITFSNPTYYQHYRCSALIHHVFSLKLHAVSINSSCTRTTFIIQYLSNFSVRNYCLCDLILVSK